MKKTFYFLMLVSTILFSCSSDDDMVSDNSSTPDPDPDPEQTENPCPEIFGLGTYGTNGYSRVLDWDYNPDHGFYEIEVGLLGFNLGEGELFVSNEPFIYLQGLSPNTTYDFYVRASCGGSSYSDWSDPFSFVAD